MTLHDFIYQTYNTLLDAGWRLKEIDDMDMLGFLKLRAWKANKDKPKKKYIDQLWPGLHP